MKNSFERAIPFIMKNQNSAQYQLTPIAQQFLKSIEKPLSIVSVAGQYRTGKSYLLNSVILDKKSIFGVGPTTNACTKGLWLWAQPDPLDKSRMMLVIDTQGLAALDEESNHDMKIFSLAVLLSTTFVYNSFGSIDETALQTLSLVLNLVNSIDKDSSSTRPQFIWVVRDFSLQLIDSEGKILSPKQYLELALTTTSKQNNKLTIRNTITNSFPQRDCFTLVKPLIDQLKLQNLDNLSIDQLRPQFVSQSIQLRNRIKTTLKAFRLNGRDEIKGRDYAIVIKKYLTAINQGVIPNIVDTWTFIKEEKKRQALDEIKKIYSDKIQAKIIDKMPIKYGFLDKMFLSMKTQIKCEYLKMTYDEESTEQLDEYLEKIFKHISQLNQQQTQRTVKKIIQKQFQPFRKKLYSDYYSNFDEYESDLKRNFKDLCIEKYEDRFDNMREYVDRYADNKGIQSFKYFQKKLKAQIKKQTQIKEITVRKLQDQLISKKERLQTSQKNYIELENNFQKKVKELKNEKNQVKQMAQTQISIVQNNTASLKRKNQELLQKIDELNNEVQQNQSILSQMRQKLFIETKDHQKEKALLIQKQQHWNRKNQDLQRKYKQIQQRFRQSNLRTQKQRKHLVSQFQQQIKDLQRNNKSLEEKATEFERQTQNMKGQKYRLQEKLQQTKKTNLSQKKILQDRIVSVQSNKKPSKLERQLKQENQQLQQELQKLNSKCSSSQSMMKVLEQEKKAIENNYQKEIAIHLQQIQFKEIQIKDLNERYDELKRTHQLTLQNACDTSRSYEENNQMRIFQITSDHHKQIQNLENMYEDKIRVMKEQLQMLQKHKQELTLQISLDKKQFQSKEKQWKQSKNALQTMCEKLEKKLQSSEKDHEDISKEKQSFYSIRVKQLEEEIQVIKQKAIQEVDEIQKKSEEAYAVLKHYSQVEKQQWEKRIQDEKDKSLKKLQNHRQEFQKKLSEQRQSLEEEINELQQRLAHMDRIYNQRIQNMQYDYDIKLQKAANQYMEEKVSLNKEIALTQQKLQITRHNYDRQLSNKIKHYQQSLENLKKSLNLEYETNIKKLSEEKQLLQSKYDSIKKSNRQLQQSNMILKNDNEKDKAVFKEKQHNYEKKISEVENRLQNQLVTFNKVIESINDKHDEQRQKSNCQIEKLNIHLLDLQEEKNKIEGDFEMQKKSLQAKIQFLESNRQKYKADYEDIMNKFEVSVSKLSKDKTNAIQKKKEQIQTVTTDYEQRIKQLQQSHKRMIKDSQDRVARYTTQNKSLKDRLTILELQKSSFSTKKKTNEYEMQRTYEKRIQQYKDVINRLREELSKLKNEKTEFSERGSFINDLSPGNSVMHQGENRPLVSRKSTNNNTPLVVKKSRRVDINEFGGIIKHNDKYKY